MSEFTPENDLARLDGGEESFVETSVNDVDVDVDVDVDADAVIGGADDVDEIEAGVVFDADEIDADEDVEFSDEIAGAELADDAAFGETDPVAFTELGLPEALVKKLAENGVQNAFPIQAATIPDALAGRHVLGKARTGSGKTLAFGLAALANLEGKRARKGKPLALVLVPTRELAMQVSDALQPYGYAIGADIAAVYGGAPMYKQVFALRRGVEVLVATPGRLTDLIEQEECDLSEVAIAILDEADQMADMGFMPIVSELLSQTDPTGQRLLFSATLDGAVDELVRQYMSDPVLHSVTPDDDEPTRMDHHLLIVEPTDKALITAEIAARHTPGDDARRTILFARTKLGADRIAEKIREHGVSALALHGGMTQRARTKTLADFKDGRVPVLVATDVAARGIHVDGIDLVLHVDPAGDPKDYLHRAGRTARAGESGTVVTLVLPKQRKSTLRLLEAAGVEAELTKVAPSSDALRELTGGRPVAEYVAEADAFHAARRAARDARMAEGGRDGHGREGFRGGRDGFRRDRDREFGGERRSFGERSERGGFDRNRGGFGGDRGGFGGERRFDRNASGSHDRFGGDRDRNRDFGGERGERSGQGRSFGERNDRGGFGGGERRSFGDRDRNGSQDRGFGGGERRSFGDRDRNGSQDRGFNNGGERRSFGDRDRTGSQDRGFGGGERRSFGDRDRNGSQDRGFGGGERRSFGDRDRNGSQDRGFNNGGERRSFGDRDRTGSQDRGFGGGERRSFGDRDRNGSQDRGFGGGGQSRSFGSDRPGQNRDSGERRPYGDRDRGASRDFGGDRGNRGGQGRTFGGDRTGSRDAGERRPYGDRDRNASGSGTRSYGDRNGSQERRSYGDRDRNGAQERPQRTAFGRPRGGYSNEGRPTRDRRW